MLQAIFARQHADHVGVAGCSTVEDTLRRDQHESEQTILEATRPRMPNLDFSGSCFIYSYRSMGLTLLVTSRDGKTSCVYHFESIIYIGWKHHVTMASG